MYKESLVEDFTEKINQNFESLSKYYNHNLTEFCELQSLKNENLNCLLLGLNQASIFSTNHLFERLIKLALIKKFTIGVNYSNSELYNEKINEAILKYDGLILNDSIKFAQEENLIDENKKLELKGLKDSFRNPYSHAETSKINKNAPDFFTGFMFNIEDVKQSLISDQEIIVPEPTHISTKSPVFAQLFQSERSNEEALEYFDKIYDLLIELEDTLSKLK